jgi:hypothetical protein
MMADKYLPSGDEIPSLICKDGMYRLDRWPATVDGQIEFLLLIKQRWGGAARISLIPEDDGYPGYIKVTPPSAPVTVS